MSHAVILAAECQTHCSLGKAYIGLMTDVPHLLFEITLTIIQDVLIGVFFWRLGLKPLMTRWQNRVHEEIDAEHGVTHNDYASTVDISHVKVLDGTAGKPRGHEEAL